MKENKTNWKCTCTREVEFGDYTNMKVFEFQGKKYQVDKCLEKEIKYLLSLGIKTIESCCGHKKVEGYIAVEEASIAKMKILGYKTHKNPLYPNAEEFFIPKTK